MKLLLSLYILFLFSPAAIAESAGKIKQIDADAQQAAVILSDLTVEVGQNLIATLEDGQQCSLKVVRIQHKVAFVSTSSCIFDRRLKAGQTVEKSLFGAKNAPAEAKKEPIKRQQEPANVDMSHEPAVRMGFSLLYNTASTTKENGTVTNTNGTFSFSGEEKTEGALGLTLFAQTRRRGNLASEFGLGYEMKRTIESANYTFSDGSTIVGNWLPPKPNFTLLYLYFNEKFYTSDIVSILAGLSLVQGDIKDSTVDLDLGFGIQLGVGFDVSPQFAIELQYKMLQLKGSEVAPGVSGEYEKIKLDGLAINFKYLP